MEITEQGVSGYTRTVYSYDTQDRKIKEEEFDLEADSECILRITWEYEKNGMIKEKSWYKVGVS